MAAIQLPSENWPEGKRPSMGAPLPENLTPGGSSDSAGFPWEGRTFDHHGTAFADDDGTTPPAVARAIQALHEAAQQYSEFRGTAGSETEHLLLDALASRHSEAVSACSSARFLIPLIAQAGDYGLTPEGRIVEKTQELSIVTVEAPDGRAVMPVFSSVAHMQNWNPLARPIPVPGPQVAVAAAQEQTDLIIIDPASGSEFGIRRPALEAFAMQKGILPAWADQEVREAFLTSIRGESTVLGVELSPGDPSAKLEAPEVRVKLTLQPGLNKSSLDAMIGRIQVAWGASEIIAERVDSMSLQLVAGEKKPTDTRR